MSTPDSVKEFVAKLRNKLRQGPYLDERITAEVEDHLVESAQNLEAQGLSQEDAAREAIARFGNPEEIARTFETDLRSEPGMTGPFLLTLLRKLCFNIAACYAAASLHHLIQQLPLVFMIATTKMRLGRIEFQAGLLTLVPDTLSAGISQPDPFWFVTYSVVSLSFIVLSLSALRCAGAWLRSFLTYLVVYSSTFLVLMLVPFVAWDGGDFSRRICNAFPSLCSSIPALRFLLGLLVGGLWLLASGMACRAVVRESRDNWMSQWVALAIWVMPVGFITVMVLTGFFQWWIVAEAGLTITFLLIMLSGLPAILMSHSRRAVS